MRLKHITFTGIDERTDIDRLREIQQAGNCKFCAERRRKEQEELIRLIKED